MRLQYLYDKIKSWKEDNMEFCIEDIFSWRGVYAEPCCSLSIRKVSKEYNLNQLDKLVTDTFIGWKGGEFTYTYDDTINFENGEGYWSDGDYILGFLANNHSEVIKHIFG